MSFMSGTAYGMPASRILPFARTSRCAIVAIGTRNARAIASVSRPPGVRELGDAGGPPLVHRDRKGLLRRLFRDVEVPNEPDQGGDDPAPIGAIDRVDGGVCIRGHIPC